jgi:hypothetical protein
MSLMSHDSYRLLLDQMLSAELLFTASMASEEQIKRAMVRVLGTLIKKNLVRRYSNLVLDEALNVHVMIYDAVDGTEFDIVLYYGQ